MIIQNAFYLIDEISDSANMFHSVCGKKITLHNSYKTAKRNVNDFNHGIVFSSELLQDNYLFEVRIEKKIYAWSGSLEIGVTKCSPEEIEMPSNATDLRNGTWILSGSCVLKDGRSVYDVYGLNLTDIEEGDVVGVMRTDQDELVFFLNGEYKGIAAHHIPFHVFAVVDLYGQVAQASIVSYAPIENIQSSVVSHDVDTFDDSDFTEGNSLLSNLVTNFDVQATTPMVHTVNFDDLSLITDNATLEYLDKLRFHERCGYLGRVTMSGRSAERTKPYEEFNNSIFMTHRPLRTGELFEVRVDRLIEKWSGSIEVGVTMHNPEFLEFPTTMTNLRTGTVMMSGCGVITNGRASKRDYGDFNLDDLLVGDRIGLIRHADKELRYLINGLDQGIAARNVPELVWGVVDLYGRTAKVTIVDRDEREEQNLLMKRMNVMRDGQWLCTFTGISEFDPNGLFFHAKCGSNIAITNAFRTAYRPSPMDDFNNGVTLTHRPLKPMEHFEVRIDRMVPKWAGVIEIGVTTHLPDDLEFPSTMTNIRSGTWMITGNGVMHNGTIVLEDYGMNLERLQVGDRVAVVIEESGSLQLLINGIDQGEIIANINDPVYGVIDMFGQVAQVTVIDEDFLFNCKTPSDVATYPLVVPSHSYRTVFRPKPYCEFANAVALGNRPLKDNEMFAVVVEKTVDRWTGSLEIGVTGVRFDEIELPATMTDMDHSTWMLSGSTLMKDGFILKYRYSLNLDDVQVGSIIGVMKHTDDSLHFYLDGVDHGEACRNISCPVYPVIDLYGQCSQVSLVNWPEEEPELSSNESSQYQSTSNWVDEVMQCVPASSSTIFERPQKCFSQWCGQNIDLSDDYTIATRVSSHDHGLVFSNFLVEPDKLYEITVLKWTGEYAGSLSIGVTTIRPEKMAMPATISCLKPDVWYMTGDEIWYNGRLTRAHYGHNLHWLERWSTIGLRISMDGALHYYINGQDQGIAAYDIPVAVYVVVDLYGSTTEVRLNPDVKDMMVSSWLPSFNLTESMVSPAGSGVQDTLAVVKDILRLDDLNAERATMEFYLLKNFEKEKEMLKASSDFSVAKEWTFFRELRGRNIRLSNNGQTATRVESYNQGLVIVSKPLERDTLLQVKVAVLNTRWVSSLMIGVLCSPITRSLLPVTAFGFKKETWLIAADAVYHNGHKIKSKYGMNLETVRVGQKVGIMVDSNNQLKLFVDGVDQGVAAPNIPPACFAFFDVYGQCEQVSIINTEDCENIVIESSLSSYNPDELINNTIDLKPVCCEKADLERHEKETPSDDDIDNNSVWLLDNISSKSDDELTASFSKRNKTNENIAMVMSHSYSSESHLKLSKTHDATCSKVVDLPNKYAKMNENISVIACSSNDDLRGETKSSTTVSTLNYEHKTDLDISNTIYVQAEQSNRIPVKPKNALNDRPSLLSKQNPYCEYRIRCLRFRDFLGLPIGFFSSDSSITCYCSACYPLITYERKGDPPVSYSVPNGWCKFPLKKHLMTNNVDALTLEKWHVAFTGVPMGSVRRILDSGQLITPDKLNIRQSTNKENKLNDEDSTLKIVLSPLIKYATSMECDFKYQYVDQKTKITYSCAAAFQVLVRPTSYKVEVTTKLKNKSQDHTYQANSIEWVVKEQQSTVLSAVLFKLEPH